MGCRLLGHRRNRRLLVGGHPDAQGAGPGHLDAVGFDHGVDELDVPARPDQGGRHQERSHRHRPEQLEGDPAQLQTVVADEGLDGAGDQRGHRSAMQRFDRPWTPGQCRGHHVSTVGNEQGGGLDGSGGRGGHGPRRYGAATDRAKAPPDAYHRGDSRPTTPHRA